jgi:hypothetical protein
MNPPIGGPSTGATRPGHVIKEVARNRCCFFVLRKTTNLPTGTIMAPPMPWMMRATTNSSRPLLNAQNIDEMVKTATAPPNTVRAPNRSAIHPLIGMKTARVSM